MEVFCFFLGVLYLYTFNSFALAIFIAIVYLHPKSSPIIYFILGFTLASTHQYLITPNNQPTKPVLQHARLEGTITEMPVASKERTQFLFATDSINKQKTHVLIQINWYNNAPELHSGERWVLYAKIKKPRNYANPGSSNQVRILATKHIQWTGYVQNGPNKKLAERQHSNLSALREQLSTQLQTLISNERYLGVVEALTLNMTHHITQEDWDLFRKTGTTHLFGISGEHIAILYGLSFFITRRLWSQSVRLCNWIPAQVIASIIALVIAFLYALLAGFQPPVQRALIGCALYALSTAGIQRFTPWQVWRYAIVGVLIFEPHAVFMQGFYFSFAAVICLLLTQQRFRLKGVKGSLALQISCLLGLMPFSLFWYSYVSLNGFVANILAIPLVGFVLIPCCLLTLLLSYSNLVGLILPILNGIIATIFCGLSWIAQWDGININWTFTSEAELLSALFALVLIFIPIKTIRLTAIIWLVLLCFPYREIPKQGDALVNVLDVGQGLSVVVRTKTHVLLFDTGDQLFEGNDFGKMVILPFFRQIRINKIDTTVISHPDKDHRGGLPSIAAIMPIKRLLVNDPSFYGEGFNCHQYPQWEWDGVHFRFFPIKAAFKNKNDTSCVLQIRTAQHQLLLPGDIEKNAENYLVQQYGAQLQSDVLILAHHGSKTSSTYRFLLEVAPKYAIASLGFDNRFRFPHQKTLTSLKALQIPFIRTDECGMTSFHLNETEIKPTCYAI